MTNPFTDIYRGYTIYYGYDVHGAIVYQDGKEVYRASGYDQALNWVDLQKKQAIKG